jgi:hypothetical protein
VSLVDYNTSMAVAVSEKSKIQYLTSEFLSIHYLFGFNSDGSMNSSVDAGIALLKFSSILQFVEKSFSKTKPKPLHMIEHPIND